MPIVGDDIKSQVGAIIHRVLTKLFEDRGVKLNRTYQLNFGGNMDFMNMLERAPDVQEGLEDPVRPVADAQKLDKQNIHIGPSDHVPWLEDRKWAQIRLEGQAFGDVPLNVELKLEVWDSPNSAGIVIDALRCAKLALDRGVAGLIGPSAYFMKSPRCSSATRRLETWSSSSSWATARARPRTGRRSSTSSPRRPKHRDPGLTVYPRLRMRLRLTEQAPLRRWSHRPFEPSDVVAVGTLLLAAYRGTVHDEGETKSDAIAEVENTIDGSVRTLPARSIVRRGGRWSERRGIVGHAERVASLPSASRRPSDMQTTGDRKSAHRSHRERAPFGESCGDGAHRDRSQRTRRKPLSETRVPAGRSAPQPPRLANAPSAIAVSRQPKTGCRSLMQTLTARLNRQGGRDRVPNTPSSPVALLEWSGVSEVCHQEALGRIDPRQDPNSIGCPGHHSSNGKEIKVRTSRSNPSTVAPPIGSYSHAVRIETADVTWIYVSGQIANDLEGTLVGPGDMRAQTQQVFENLRAILAANEATFRTSSRLGPISRRSTTSPACARSGDT